MSTPDTFIDHYGDIIYRYTRTDALADGILIDISPMPDLPVMRMQKLWNEDHGL